jgi:hypothetical protein
MRIVFRREGDRMGHRIEVLRSGQFVPVLESKEGDSLDAWPSSPVLQTVHLEPRADGPVALLVGAAGISHWSASVAAHTAKGRATFDVACRTSGEVEWLGSSYVRLTPSEQEVWQMLSIDPGAAVLLSADTPIVAMRVEPDEKASARTIRWSYVVQAVV